MRAAASACRLDLARGHAAVSDDGWFSERSIKMKRLKERAEFLAVAQGVRSARRGFVLQAVYRRKAADAAEHGNEVAEPRCGFTVTKKIGNSVVRNRIRRRLREAIRLHGEGWAEPGIDYVLVGRDQALSLSFDELKADLVGAFGQAHGRLKNPGSSDQSSRRRSGQTGKNSTGRAK